MRRARPDQKDRTADAQILRASLKLRGKARAQQRDAKRTWAKEYQRGGRDRKRGWGSHRKISYPRKLTIKTERAVGAAGWYPNTTLPHLKINHIHDKDIIVKDMKLINYKISIVFITLILS